MKEFLSAAQEAEAQRLAQEIGEAVLEEVLQLARTLVDSDDATLFGPREFAVRDIVHRIAAKAYQKHLASKKTATTDPA